MTNAIHREFRKAWLEGAKSCSIYEGELTDAELAQLDYETNQEYLYVVNFSYDIMQGTSLDPLLTRADQWAASYARVRNLGQAMACADQKMLWSMNAAKEHCVDCLRLDGKVYRGSDWANFVTPMSRQLACFGSYCGCTLTETSKPISRGRKPGIG